jgi:hypothetical protein
MDKLALDAQRRGRPRNGGFQRWHMPSLRWLRNKFF